ncbi:Non-S-locus F-box protein 23 [Forsythia ovata]|uniref:Non-S-locus F-box protein 23 n=1 Tax=Forsythia ovata TaxID=205694 RepID=A0ABD1S4I1_9LAMI
MGDENSCMIIGGNNKQVWQPSISPSPIHRQYPFNQPSISPRLEFTGPVVQKRTWTSSPEISDALRFDLDILDDKLTLPVEPMFTITIVETLSVSVLVGRKDLKKLLA